jgi:regulatory protein
MSRQITGLKPQTNRRNRVNIYLDGKFGFGLHKALAYKLVVGQELNRERIDELKRLDQREAAYQRAANLIARRPRSEGELRRRLARLGLPEDEQTAVIGRLRKAGLANDLEFAQAWIENRMEFRPRAAYALRSELRSKGVSPELIDEALGDFDEDEAARRAAKAGARKYRNLSPDLFRRRLGAYLSRRGFTYQTVSPLIKGLVVEREQESEGKQ